MTNPVDSVLVDGVAVSKEDLRVFLGALAIFDSPATAQTFGLTDTRVIITLQDAPNGIGTYLYDSADIVSAHDPANGVIVSSAGRRFKRTNPSSFFTSAQLLAILTAGTIPLDRIADGTANRIMGWGADLNADELTSAEVIAAIDAATGSTVWRTAAQSFVNPVLSLSQRSRNGDIAHDQNMLLMRDGTVRVAGDNTSTGALGPFTADVLEFLRLPQPSGVTFTKLFQGSLCAFAIDSDGYPWAIGVNSDGHLGLGDTDTRTAWTRIPFFFDNTITVSDIAPSEDDNSNPPRYGTLFLSVAGTPYYAGNNAVGQAGNTTSGADVTTPIQWGSPTFNFTNTTLISIGGGVEVGCFVLDNGNLYASGSGNSGKLGNGGSSATNATAAQITLPNSNLITQIEQARNGSFVVLSNGELWGTGDNSDNQLADGTTTDSNVFVQITAVSTTVDRIAISRVTGNISLAAVLTNGNLETWGDNASGCLGLGSTGGVIATPTQPAGSFQGSVTQALFGGNTTKNLYIQAGNQLYSVGENGQETLVNGTVGTDSNTFTEVSGVKGTIQDWNVQGADANDAQCLLVLTDEAMLVGGRNTGGKLGLGVTNNIPSLQEVNLPVVFG